MILLPLNRKYWISSERFPFCLLEENTKHSHKVLQWLWLLWRNFFYCTAISYAINTLFYLFYFISYFKLLFLPKIGLHFASKSGGNSAGSDHYWVPSPCGVQCIGKDNTVQCFTPWNHEESLSGLACLSTILSE